jgi:hypothetical protein
MGQKFEMVEVHPLYARGRLAIAKYSPEGINSLSKICKVEDGVDSQLKFRVFFGEDQGQEIDFDETIFASKVFITQLS